MKERGGRRGHQKPMAIGWIEEDPGVGSRPDAPVRAYPTEREATALYGKLAALTEEYVGLARTSVQRRIAIAHRIGCVKYAIDRPDAEVCAIFGTAADAVPALMANRRIEPSLAMSAWGIAALGKRTDVLKLLATADHERLGSTHGIARYTAMLVSLFRCMQAVAAGRRDESLEHIARYDRDYSRKRTSRAFGHWSRGLRDILDATRSADRRETDAAIMARCEYLERSYRTDDECLDHEGLLDVHGLGVIAALHLGGFATSASGSSLPTHLIG